MVLGPTVRYRNVFSNNTHEGTEMGLRVSSHVITACRWTEGPFLADGTVMHNVGASPGHTIRFPSLGWSWPMGSMTLAEGMLSFFF